MKRAIFIIVGLLIVTVAVMSCKKNAMQIRPPMITGFSPQYDTLGGTVTIVGIGFTGASAVSFGGSPAASFTIVSDDTITAVVGLGGTGNVSVTTPGGIGTRAGFRFPLIFCGCNSSDAVVPPYFLIAHWPFDGNANEVVSNSGILSKGGDTAYVKGRIGQAIRLTNGWLTYPASNITGVVNSAFNTNDTLQNGFTITLWVQMNKANTADTLLHSLFQLSGTDGTTPYWPLAGIAAREFGASDSLLLFGGITNRDSAGVLGTRPSYDSASFKSYVRDTLQWAFIALVYDSSSHSLQYYFNGNLYGNALVGQSPFLMGNVSGSVFKYSSLLNIPAPNYATIGAFESKSVFGFSLDSAPPPSFMAGGFTGVIDDIRFYDLTLSSQNINDLYVLGGEGK